MNQDCIFCKIIAGIIPCNKIYETDDILVVQDIAPKAPIHYLILPKKHIKNIQSCTLQDQRILGLLLLTATQLSVQNPKAAEFKLVSNNGSSVGQTVHHIHFHFLAGGGNFIATASV